MARAAETLPVPATVTTSGEMSVGRPSAESAARPHRRHDRRRRSRGTVRRPDRNERVEWPRPRSRQPPRRLMTPAFPANSLKATRRGIEPPFSRTHQSTSRTRFSRTSSRRAMFSGCALMTCEKNR